MKKTLSAVFLTLSLVTSTSAAEKDFFPSYNAFNRNDLGCELNGERYKVGELAAMNSTDLDNFKKLTGYRAADGYAVMMMCSFIVDPSKQDYPTPDKRSFVWVAF